MSKVFLDTNIFVYAMDESEPRKLGIAKALLSSFENRDEDQGVASTQVMQELYAVISKKKGTAPLLAKAIVRNLQRYEIVAITPQLVLEAIDCSLLSRISFWDALIVACAESAGCERIITEDLNPGQIIRGVRVENPFAT